MNLPRVLLVEDDASIARFVQMALEELPIELVTCSNVPDAMQALRDSCTQLIITDLMLPGESGIDLVQRLLHEPGLGRSIPVAVFSAGLTPAVRDQLNAMKVWRMLSKPASVAELEDCVRDALALKPDEVEGRPPGDTLAAETDASTAEAQAIATHFAGDEFLFKAYRASCLQQFPVDVRQGDVACTAQDWAALRRLAHSLVTVLLTLGYPTESVRARQLENAAANLTASQCAEHWGMLRAFLTRL
ncbi:response regulator receiver domain-containing protein [Acidovorax sp. 69]|uniref:response regulator n=1 Tax=Acidovorax sp. 69 TaxID=2035202 RepID=UPI000C24CF85|nr:response regulator [Acidovorax sp. 69]PJI98572.1 response regulator receiver domain-containing protein [Acidovorax sp. 69]